MNGNKRGAQPWTFSDGDVLYVYPYNNMAQHDMYPIFLFNNHSTLLYRGLPVLLIITG